MAESCVRTLRIGDEYFFSDDLYVRIEPDYVTVYVTDLDIDWADFRLIDGEYIGVLDGAIVKYSRDSRAMPCRFVEIIDVVGKYGELADHAVEYRSNVESGYWSPYKGLETVMRRHKVSESIARDILGLS